jgi:hypothetical protein
MIDAWPDSERRRLLAEHGRYVIGAPPGAVETAFRRFLDDHPDTLLTHLRHHASDLARACATLGGTFPGRAEALLAVARALGRPLPAAEYQLPEDALESLLERARAARGRRVPVRGKSGHKGRVGDGVERLLLGGQRAAVGRTRDHAAAEIKSVPVHGDRVIERVKLGVVSARSNPLEKCDRVLFVFVERRGEDHFVRGYHLHDFDPTSFDTLWRDGLLVETAAGSPRHKTRGLYLVPKFFRSRGLWPPA